MFFDMGGVAHGCFFFSLVHFGMTSRFCVNFLKSKHFLCLLTGKRAKPSLGSNVLNSCKFILCIPRRQSTKGNGKALIAIRESEKTSDNSMLYS